MIHVPRLFHDTSAPARTSFPLTSMKLQYCYILNNPFLKNIYFLVCKVIKHILIWYLIGMGRYEKYVHQDVANAKPYTKKIPGFRILVHPKQTWTFPLHDITIKVTKCMKYEIKVYNFFRFLVCSQYFKFSLSYMG